MLLLHTQSLPGYGLERIFMVAQKAGFDGLELQITENYDTQDADYIKELSARYKIPVKAFCIQPGKEEKLMEAFQNLIKNFPRSTVNLVSSNSFTFRYKKWLQNIMPQIVRKYDLNFNLRNAPFKTMLGFIPERAENSLYALKQAGNVCLDVSALWSSKEEIMRAVEFLGDRMRHVYLSNVHNNEYYNLLPEGILPLESFLTKLAQRRYHFGFTLKIAPDNLPQGSVDKIIHELEASRKFFEKYFINVQKKLESPYEDPGQSRE